MRKLMGISSEHQNATNGDEWRPIWLSQTEKSHLRAPFLVYGTMHCWPGRDRRALLAEKASDVDTLRTVVEACLAMAGTSKAI